MTEAPEPTTPDLIALLLTARTLERFLAVVARTAIALAPGSEGCGITLEQRGEPLTVASTGADAVRLDEKQYGQNDGPCLQALRTGKEVAVPEMLTERRWGDYPAYAVARGTRSSLSIPISSSTRTRGAINLYAARPDGFADADLLSLRSVAAQATGAIALAQRMTEIRSFDQELSSALTARTDVGRAIGITMARSGGSPSDALATLTATARDGGTTLHQVCADLVGRRGEPPEPPADL